MRRTFFVTQRHRTSVPRRLAAVVHTFSLVMLFAASSAPTPLYRIYQASWGFSPVMLTVVFGAYALALLAALLTAGSLSDFLGRRPVIMLALLLAATSMRLFLLAVGPHWLIAARLVQGLATGIATTAFSAALLDLNHQRGALINSIAPMAGMAIGAMGSSALLILVPAPLHLVFVILLVAFASCLAMTWWTPETGGGRPGALAIACVRRWKALTALDAKVARGAAGQTCAAGHGARVAKKGRGISRTQNKLPCARC